MKSWIRDLTPTGSPTSYLLKEASHYLTLENGTDVDTWTFDELCEIVLQFQELATAEYQVG